MPHKETSHGLTVPREAPQDLTPSRETSQGAPRPPEVPAETIPETRASDVQIPEHQQIFITGALSIAIGEGLDIGKSTLQRHAKRWHEAGEASAVKCVLVTNRSGKHYALDRESFVSWVLDELAQQETTYEDRGLKPSRETSQGALRPPEVPPRRAAQSPAREDSRSEDARPDTSDRVVSMLERDNQWLREQITTKDTQIKDLTERARETNHLIGGLQRLVAQLQLGPGHKSGEGEAADL